MRPLPAIPALLIAFVLCGTLVIQHRRIQQMASDLAWLRTELGVRPAVDPVPEPASSDRTVRVIPTTSASDTSLLPRLSAVEDSLAKLMEANEHLMNRGQLPLSPEKQEQLLAQLGDASANERERLQALRLLRRNGVLDDDAVQLAVGWLNSSTNGGLQLRLLQQLGGLTNAALRDPMLAIAVSGGSAEARQRAIGALRPFVNDPQVEAQLWDLLQKDGESGVRRQARDALVDSPVSESRAAALRLKATNPGSSLDERTVAWESLRASGHGTPEVSAALSLLAQSTTDAQDRLRLFEAFNQASDPAFIPPLVQGLQDPSPLVRARAADALSDFRTDPAIEEWYRYLAENDADPAVRRQAARVLNPPSREGRERPPGRERNRP